MTEQEQIIANLARRLAKRNYTFTPLVKDGTYGHLLDNADVMVTDVFKELKLMGYEVAKSTQPSSNPTEEEIVRRLGLWRFPDGVLHEHKRDDNWRMHADCTPEKSSK